MTLQCKKLRSYRAMLACSVVLAGISFVRGADAQTQTPTTQPQDSLEEVVVTGSLIRQPNITATSPLTTVDRVDFGAAGLLGHSERTAALARGLRRY